MSKATEKQRKYVKTLLSIYAKMNKQRLGWALDQFHIASIDDMGALRASVVIERLHKIGVRRELERLAHNRK